ncbi:MAG: hypothetical protein FWE29_06740 [Defluviitaleaceae bacterium]|nr:hypothetical protein [Defluviitaleaceae bacterium]
MPKVKSILTLALAAIATFLITACTNAVPYESEHDNPFEQIFGLSDHIQDIDEYFIEAVRAAIYISHPTIQDKEYLYEEAVEELIEEITNQENLEVSVIEPESVIEFEIKSDYDHEEIIPIETVTQPLRNWIFRLSEHEEQLYHTFLNSMDISVLAGEEPRTIGKIFIQLALNEELAVSYNLLAKTEGLITKEQYIETGEMLLSMMDAATRRNFANREFGDIDYREFVTLTETTGYFEHRSLFGFTHRINFIKNAEDVWLIEFFEF